MSGLDLYASIESSLPFEQEINYLYDIFKDIVIETAPKTLIDIGCGQGEFCKIIEQNSIKAKGVDLSSKQIELAKAKKVDASCVDIKDIDEKFDCATAIFDVVNYIPNEQIDQFLQNSYNLLNKGGYFIFDINSLFGFSEVAIGTLTINEPDRFIAIDAVFEDNILNTSITLFEKQQECYKKTSDTIKQYYYSNKELTIKLEKIGFIIEHIEAIDLHDFGQNDKNIFICRRK